MAVDALVKDMGTIPHGPCVMYLVLSLSACSLIILLSLIRPITLKMATVIDDGFAD